MFRLLESIDEVSAESWNGLAPAQAFLRHEWLSALEQSGAVGHGTGWQPAHPSLWDGERLLAAAPAYFKHHSWGEYVFDWAWAEAYQRNGLPYYPKWLCAIPFTPVTGQRLLARTPAHARQLLGHMQAAALSLDLSSLHILFPEDRQSFADAPDMLVRHGVQFHWHNRGFASFEDFLAALSHDKRKKIHQDRKKVFSQGVSLRTLEGRNISEEIWALFHRCYSNTYALHGATPYLELPFFLQVAQTMPQACVMMVASRGGRDIACSLLIRDDTRLYGRYWGALEHVSCLHFECCYYAPIEYAIAQGIQVFEGGAQGEHKLARGLDPVPTCSYHWIADTRFRDAIQRFLAQESHGMQHYIDELAEHSAYRAAPD